MSNMCIYFVSFAGLGLEGAGLGLGTAVVLTTRLTHTSKY